MRTLPSDARRPASVRGGLLGAILALALLAGGPAGARAEDESPDLQVELLRTDGGPLPLSDGQQELQVRITNVSVWWATETALRVETVSPEAGNVLEIAVENLDPGQSVTYPYTLAAACAGHV